MCFFRDKILPCLLDEPIHGDSFGVRGEMEEPDSLPEIRRLRLYFLRVFWMWGAVPRHIVSCVWHSFFPGQLVAYVLASELQAVGFNRSFVGDKRLGCAKFLTKSETLDAYKKRICVEYTFPL